MSNLSFSSQNPQGNRKKQVLNAHEKQSVVVQRVNVNFYMTIKGNRPARLSQGLLVKLKDEKQMNNQWTQG